jgi:hypothetical protein
MLAESQARKLMFPEVVRRLTEVGVESSFRDLVRGEEIFLFNGWPDPSREDGLAGDTD